MSRGVSGRNNILILEAGRMKREDKMCNLEKIRSEFFYYYIHIYIIIYIYIYMRVFL